MFGYFLSNGTCGEWGQFSHDGSFSWEDYSRPALDAFRAWLAKEYKNDDERAEKLRHAGDFRPEDIHIPDSKYTRENNKYHHWLDDPELVDSMSREITSACMDEAMPPNGIRRHIGRYGIFRNPEESWDTIEFLRFTKESFAEIIAYFTDAAKEASGGRSLTGVFTGYLLQEYLCDSDDGYRQFALQQILEKAHNLDVVTNPYHYYRIESITGDTNCKTVHGSINLTDKLFVDENDQRTCLADRELNKSIGTPGEDLAGSAEALKRNFILRLTRGAGLWWYDFGRGWYDNPMLMETISKLARIHQKLLDKGIKPGEVDTYNIIYSTEVYDYIASCSNLVRRNCASHMQRHINRSGVPWEIYFLEDLPRAPKRKAYLFLNTFAVNDGQREYIERELKKDGNLLIWLYASGLYNGDSAPSIANASRLTGFDQEWSMEWREILIRITNFNHPITAGLEGLDFPDFGTTVSDDPNTSPELNKVSPIIYSVDRDAQNLGVLDGTELAGFAAKDFGTWKSVFIGSPIVPAAVMRRILEWGGLHPVTDEDDALYTDGRMVGIHAKETGIKNVSLQEGFLLTDTFARQAYASQGNRIELPMHAGETLFGVLSDA
jgi:hypothetical protein